MPSRLLAPKFAALHWEQCKWSWPYQPNEVPTLSQASRVYKAQRGLAPPFSRQLNHPELSSILSSGNSPSGPNCDWGRKFQEMPRQPIESIRFFHTGPPSAHSQNLRPYHGWFPSRIPIPLLAVAWSALQIPDRLVATGAAASMAQRSTPPPGPVACEGNPHPAEP